LLLDRIYTHVELIVLPEPWSDDLEKANSRQLPSLVRSSYFDHSWCSAVRSGEAALMAVGASAPTKILKFSANFQIFTSNAPPLAQIIRTPLSVEL
jgi:hypothetical protein